MTRRLLETLTALETDPIIVERRFSRTVGDVGRPSLGKVLAVPALLARVLATSGREPDLAVVFLTNRPGSFLVDVAVLRVLRSLGLKIVLYVHTVGFAALARRGTAWAALVRWALRTGRVVTLGPSLLADVEPFVSIRPALIPNATVAPPAAVLHGDAGSACHVVYLSNLQPEKGALVFVEVAAALAVAGGDWRFTIAGAGSDEQSAAVHAAIEAAALTDRIEVRGPVDEAGKWALLGDADLLLFPSTYPFEAQPLTIVEAMACGVPVVAYDTGGVRDLIEDRVTGRLIPAGDVAGLTDAVAAIAADPAAAGMRAAALSRFATQHSLTAYRAAWQDLLQMTDRPAPAAPDFADSGVTLRRLVRADWRANPRDPKSRAVLVALRLCQWAIRDPEHPRVWSWALVALYRFWTEFGIGLELRPKTRIGGGLTIYHGYGLVVNDHARIGPGVVIRNGVTIGHRVDGGPTPVIGAGVQLGAGAIVLGGVTIGDGARIGAGAVVLGDVPAGASAVGNPARILPGPA